MCTYVGAPQSENFVEFVCVCVNFCVSVSLTHQVVDTPQSADIFVWNLPMTQGDQRIRWRLKTLSQNCGGRIIVISRPMAVLRFPTLEMAMRFVLKKFQICPHYAMNRTRR